MARIHAPIRWDKIREAREFLRIRELENSLSYVKDFYLYRYRTSIKDGLSIFEHSIIHRPDQVYKDPKTGETLPTNGSINISKSEYREIRKRMRQDSIILYCLTDKETGAQVYFNITTMELYNMVMRRIDKIIKGMQKNKKIALDLLKLSTKERKKLLKVRADQIEREHLERLKKELSKERKEELKQILKQKEIEREEREKVTNEMHRKAQERERTQMKIEQWRISQLDKLSRFADKLSEEERKGRQDRIMRQYKVWTVQNYGRDPKEMFKQQQQENGQKEDEKKGNE